MRTYLRDFGEAVKNGDRKEAEQRMLGKYPQYHVKQFLSAFSIPAYFPSAQLHSRGEPAAGSKRVGVTGGFATPAGSTHN